jgi:hypothetical protein
MIHKKIFDSDQFNGLTLAERVLYFALIVNADDEGRFRMDAPIWKRRVFHSDRIGTTMVQIMLDHITEAALVVRYEALGGTYGQHPNWHKYQTLRADRCKKSDFPPPPADKLPPDDNQPAPKDKASKEKIIEAKINEVNFPQQKNNLFNGRETMLRAYEETKGLNRNDETPTEPFSFNG